MQFGNVEPAEHEAADDPDTGKNGGQHIGGARRAALQRAQNLADRFAVVVGGPPQRTGIFRTANFLVERIGVGRASRPQVAPRGIAGAFGERRRGRGIRA